MSEVLLKKCIYVQGKKQCKLKRYQRGEIIFKINFLCILKIITILEKKMPKDLALLCIKCLY